MSSGEVIKVLREVNSKLDTILNRLMALENCILEVEEPEPEDIEAYIEAEREFKEGKLKHFVRK